MLDRFTGIIPSLPRALTISVMTRRNQYSEYLIYYIHSSLSPNAVSLFNIISVISVPCTPTSIILYRFYDRKILINST